MPVKFTNQTDWQSGLKNKILHRLSKIEQCKQKDIINRKIRNNGRE